MSEVWYIPVLIVCSRVVISRIVQENYVSFEYANRRQERIDQRSGKPFAIYEKGKEFCYINKNNQDQDYISWSILPM